MQVQEWLIERQQLLERIKELEAENTELRKRLGEDVTSSLSTDAAACERYVTLGASETFLSPEGTSLCGRRCDTLPP